MQKNTVTSIRVASGVATKTFTRDAVIPYKNTGTYSGVQYTEVGTAEDLYECVKRYSGEPSWHFILGSVRADARVERFSRKLVENGGDIERTPESWVMFDFDWTSGDKVEALVEAGISYKTPKRAAKYFIELLHPEFRDVSCVWQLSSSAGLKPGVSMHLFFLLDTAIGFQERKNWLYSIKEADRATYKDSQPLYVASPIFKDGVSDPVPERVGLLVRGQDRVVVPRLSSFPEFVVKLLGSTESSYEVANKIGVRYGLKGLLPDYDALADELVRRGGKKSTEQYIERLRDGYEHGKKRSKTQLQLMYRVSGEGNQTIAKNHANIVEMLLRHPSIAGKLAINVRTGDITLRSGGWLTGEDKDVPVSYDAPSLIIKWLNSLIGVMFDQTQIRPALTEVWVVLMRTGQTFDPLLEVLGIDPAEKPDPDSIEDAGLDTWLVDAGIGGDDPDFYVNEVGRSLLMSLAARTLRPGCQVDTVTVFLGPQGTGKTSLARALGSLIPDGHISVTEFACNDTTTMTKYSHAMVVELGEMRALRGAHRDQAKEHITRTVDTTRRLFSHDFISQPRRFVFVATSNDVEMFDDVENRRFLIVEMPKRAVVESDTIKRLLREACLRVLAGEAWHITDERVIEYAARKNAEHKRTDPASDAVQAWLKNEGYPAVVPASKLNAVIRECGYGSFAGDHRAKQVMIAAKYKRVGLNWCRRMDVDELVTFLAPLLVKPVYAFEKVCALLKGRQAANQDISAAMKRLGYVRKRVGVPQTRMWVSE